MLECGGSQGSIARFVITVNIPASAEQRLGMSPTEGESGHERQRWSPRAEAMKILVLLRMSPDPDGALELKADGSGLDREWMDPKLNEFDDHALEQAVLLKEATAGSVIAVAIGEGSQRTLQMAIARGATSSIAIEWPEAAMILTPAIAPTVAGLARDHGVDVVMTGVQTSEDIL